MALRSKSDLSVSAYNACVSSVSPITRAAFHRAFTEANSLPPLNGSLFHELLQLLDGVHHHAADLGERWAARFASAPPALKREDADSEIRRCFLLADVTASSMHRSIRSC